MSANIELAREPQNAPRAATAFEELPEPRRPDDALALISTRHNVSPRRLVAPGPDEDQCAAMFAAAAAAPDHGRLTPWRFIVVPTDKRELLAEAFALALIDRDPGATLEQIEAARDKAHRAPFVALAIVRLAEETDPAIPNVERIVSLGCAIQNLLLAAHAVGFGSGLTSGRSIKSERVCSLFRLNAGEEPVCFVNVGTVSQAKPGRERPSSDAVASLL